MTFPSIILAVLTTAAELSEALQKGIVGENFDLCATVLSECRTGDQDFAIEDSPASFKHVLQFDGCRIPVFDRPWNENTDFPNDNFIRCKNWAEVDAMLREF